jgi:phenylalanyl-tRNA synthetase beta chain
LQEAATFTFIEREAADPFVADAATLVPIANPLSEKFSVLRPSLLPGLLDALVYNRRREQETVRLFELGAAFSSAGERRRIGWLMTGSRQDHWSERHAPLDFFDARGIAELVAAGFGIALEASPTDDLPWFVRGRGARLTAAGASGAIEVGSVGQIRPAIATSRGLGQADAVTGGELDLAALDALRAPDAERIRALPRHPSVVRDLSILVEERLPAAEVRGTIRAIAPPILVAVREFDRYQGKGVPDGWISLSLRLTFRAADRTLTDAEVQVAVDAVVAALATAHGATLRGAAGSTAGE